MTKRTDYIYDEWLVLRCRSGDSDALKELIDRWHERLRRVVWRLTNGHPDGADIVQEVWMTVVRKLNRLDDPAAFPHWLYQIASAKCADWIRSQRRDRSLKEAVELEESRQPAQQRSSASEPEAKTTIRQGLAALSDDQRLILTLFYIDELSTAEIAGILEVPVGTVKSRLYNARNELRKQLERSKS